MENKEEGKVLILKGAEMEEWNEALKDLSGKVGGDLVVLPSVSAYESLEKVSKKLKFNYKKLFKDTFVPEKPKSWTDSGYDVRAHNFKVAYSNGGKFVGHEQKIEAGEDGCIMGMGTETSISINPGERVLIGTGLAMEVPIGYEIQVRNRSGAPLKTGLQVLNSPGTVDCGYRGEIGVILGNQGLTNQTILKGDRIAQIVIAPVALVPLTEVEELEESVRGDEGFGSSGKQ
jgi:dUTP pyrophosphatase